MSVVKLWEISLSLHSVIGKATIYITSIGIVTWNLVKALYPCHWMRKFN